MARAAKGRIARRQKKRSKGTVIPEVANMGAQQHKTYVALLKGDDHQDCTLPTHVPHPAPPQAKRIKSLPSLEHPDRKRARMNKNLVEAFDAARSLSNMEPIQTTPSYGQPPWNSPARSMTSSG